MPFGPCIRCGKTNYSRSLGGDYICSPCDDLLRGYACDSPSREPEKYYHAETGTLTAEPDNRDHPAFQIIWQANMEEESRNLLNDAEYIEEIASSGYWNDKEGCDLLRQIATYLRNKAHNLEDERYTG